MMKHTLLSLLGILIAVNVAPASYAQVVQCKGVLGKITVVSIHVPTNHQCVLKGTTVKGNVTVDRNARLLASDVTIQGNVLAKDALYLDLGSLSEVKGFIQRPALLRNPWP